MSQPPGISTKRSIPALIEENLLSIQSSEEDKPLAKQKPILTLQRKETVAEKSTFQLFLVSNRQSIYKNLELLKRDGKLLSNSSSQTGSEHLSDASQQTSLPSLKGGNTRVSNKQRSELTLKRTRRLSTESLTPKRPLNPKNAKFSAKQTQHYQGQYQGYPPQGYPPQGYPPQGYPQQGYQQGYHGGYGGPQQGYAPQYQQQGYRHPPPGGAGNTLKNVACIGSCLACLLMLCTSCCQAAAAGAAGEDDDGGGYDGDD